MSTEGIEAVFMQPENTAVRVALWRALHLEVDGLPQVIEDHVGLHLAAPDDGWRRRPDMHPQFTAGFRASIVARARFIEDLVEGLIISQQGAAAAGTPFRTDGLRVSTGEDLLVATR